MKKKGDTRKLICTSETGTEETNAGNKRLQTRTDVEWRLGEDDSAPGVAVLEFKRKHTMNPGEINKAKSPKTTGFGGSASIVKQVTHYALKHFTPKLNDVCAFDWDTLWIFNLEGWDESQPTKGLPKCLLHQEQGQEQGKKQYTFRQLLLAFLIRALIRTNPNLGGKGMSSSLPYYP